MEVATPTLEGVRGDLTKLRDVARRLFAQHPVANDGEFGVWTLEDYMACTDELEEAIDRALALPQCTQERFEAEKFARNGIAERLYYRGRLCLRTGSVGRFYKKSGDKGIHWAPTELSRMADRLAAEPLRQIYKATEACVRGGR